MSAVRAHRCGHTRGNPCGVALGAAARTFATAVAKAQIDVRAMVERPDDAAENARKRRCPARVVDSIPRIVQLHGEAVVLRTEVRLHTAAAAAAAAAAGKGAEAARVQVEQLRAERKGLSKRGHDRVERSRNAERAAQVRAAHPAFRHRDCVCVRARLLAHCLQIKMGLAKSTERLAAVDAELVSLVLQQPNTTHPSTPCGGEEAAEVIRTTWDCDGPSPAQKLVDPRDHLELGTRLGACNTCALVLRPQVTGCSNRAGMFDFDAGAQVSGSKFVYMRSAGALLELGLTMWAMKTMASRGFTPVITPGLRFCAHTMRAQTARMSA